MSKRICDFRFAICDLAAARREPRTRHDRSQFARFLPKRIDLGFRQQTAVDNQLHPISRLIGFFLHGAQFCNELGFGTTATRRAIVCADRCPASYQLPAERATSDSFRECGYKFEHPQRELFSPVFQFGFIHKAGEVRNCSANRKSQI